MKRVLVIMSIFNLVACGTPKQTAAATKVATTTSAIHESSRVAGKTFSSEDTALTIAFGTPSSLWSQRQPRFRRSYPSVVCVGGIETASRIEQSLTGHS